MLSTLGRAAKVLDLFTVETPEWGATAVAHELQIAKSQAHELLVSLAVGGLLQRVGMGRYRLGWRIVALNAVLVETSDLLRLVAPEMQALVGRYGETVHVAVWDGRPVCIDARSGRLHTSVPPFRVGADLPACSTALGKVLLAGRPRDEITQFLSGDEQAAQVGLGQVAAQGFAYEEQEYHPGSLLGRGADHQSGRGGLRVDRHVRAGRALAARPGRLPARRGLGRLATRTRERSPRQPRDGVRVTWFRIAERPLTVIRVYGLI